MKLRKSMLSASIATALLFAAAAQAQGAAPQPQTTTSDQQSTQATAGTQATDQSKSSKDKKNLQTLEAIQVVGIRASLAQSLQIKREANAVVDAVTAEDLGKFPNTNVAEAMTQIPGVTLDRNMGQGDLVSIDGTDPSLNETFLNGHLVAQVPWLYGANPSRGFDFTMLPPQIVGNIEVYKSPEARLPEGSVGGTIMVHTREPLDLPANSIAGSIGFTYNDQAGHFKPTGAILYSWKNPQQTVGFDVSASHYEEQINRQGIEIFSYNTVSQFPNSGSTADPSTQVPSEVNAAYFQQTRKRDSATMAFQFKPNDRFELTAHGLYIHDNYSNWNQSLYPLATFSTQTVDSLGQATDGVIPNGHACSSVFSNPCLTPGAAAAAGANPASSLFDSNPRVSTVSIYGLDFGGKYNGDHWGVSAQVGASYSKDPHNWMYDWEANYQGGFTFDENKGVTFDNPAAARDPANWYVGGINGSGGNGINEQAQNQRLVYGQIDFHNDFDSVFDRLQYGIRYNRSSTNQTDHNFNAVGTGTMASTGVFGGYVDGINSNFPGYSPDQANHIQPNEAAEIAWINSLPMTETPSGYINGTYSITEKTWAAYVQQDFATDNLTGNFGVRYVHTATDSSAFQPVGAPVLPAPTSWWQTTSGSYNEWLPSFNIAYDTGHDVTLRAAASETIARVPVNQEANTLFLNDNTTPPSGTGGNANLSPYKSYNFNLTAEWYFAPQSVLSFEGFFKSIRNYIVTEAKLEPHFNQLHDTDPSQFAILVAGGYCQADGTCQYSIARPTNGGAGKIRGFNLAYQQAFGDTGFGLVASATYSNGVSSGGGPLPYNSKYSVNFSPYFEKGPFSARVTYGWRSKYFAGGYVAGAPPAYTNDYNELDATASWQFNKNFSVTLSALNLTNQLYWQYYGTKSLPANRYYNGRRYMGTLNFKF